MKITRKFLEKKYDELYDRAKAVIVELEPCLICVGKDKAFCARDTEGSVALCCEAIPPMIRRCKHLRPTGCRVKSLRCAVWYCQDINRVWKETRKFYLGRSLAYTAGPILNQEHKDIMTEMSMFELDGLFREGKEKAIEYALKKLSKKEI